MGNFPIWTSWNIFISQKCKPEKKRKKKRNQNSKLIEIQKFIYTLFVFSKQHNTTQHKTRQDKTRIITTTKNGVVFT